MKKENIAHTQTLTFYLAKKKNESKRCARKRTGKVFPHKVSLLGVGFFPRALEPEIGLIVKLGGFMAFR